MEFWRWLPQLYSFAGGDDAVKLDAARLSCQGRYLPQVPHSSSSSFSLPPSLPFLYVWVSACLPLSSILFPSNTLLLYRYFALHVLASLCHSLPLLYVPWPAFTPHPLSFLRFFFLSFTLNPLLHPKSSPLLSSSSITLFLTYSSFPPPLSLLPLSSNAFHPEAVSPSVWPGWMGAI